MEHAMNRYRANIMNMQPHLHSFRGPSRERGVMALVAAVVILATATLVTLYTASPVRTEQQVTGNERRSFQALNAAEAGLAQAMATITQYDHDDFLDDSTPFVNTLCVPTTLADGGTFVVLRVNGQDCTAGWPAFGADELVLGYRSIPVVVEGRSDDGVAVRTLGQTFFIFDSRDPNPGGGNLAPLNFAGTVTEFNAASSAVFQVVGGGGAAVATSSTDMKNFVEAEIEKTGKQDNYQGGVSGTGFGEPFDTPQSLADFIKAIEPAATATGPVNAGNHTWSEGVYRVSGDMEIKGNQSGSGVLIVEGNLTTYGTPDWTGLIIVLGGEYEVKGGGGGDYYGSIFVANLNPDDATPAFGDTAFNVAGGGNLQFYASEAALKNACNLLPLDAQDLWDCDLIEVGGSEVITATFEPVTGIISGSWVDFQ
jgi:hypothetical protein